MLLAIKGDVNNIYKLTRNELKLIKQQLKGISNKQFKENKYADACKWLRINSRTKFLNFIQCEKRLKDLGYISRNKDYKKIYAEEEPKIIKKIPGEIELKRIEISMQDNARSSFLWYIAEGGDNVAFGEFKGKVIQVKKNKGVLFKEIYVEFDEMDGTVINKKENHVWIFDCQEFLNMGIQVGDCVKFNALAYAYRKKDGNIDFGLKAPQWIQYIPDYEL